jgi:hypothetical protein
MDEPWQYVNGDGGGSEDDDGQGDDDMVSFFQCDSRVVYFFSGVVLDSLKWGCFHFYTSTVE